MVARRRCLTSVGSKDPLHSILRWMSTWAKQVTKGYRLCLIYNLLYTGSGSLPALIKDGLDVSPLRDPAKNQIRFRMNQARRFHIEKQLNVLKCGISHFTECTGSSQTLVVNKVMQQNPIQERKWPTQQDESLRILAHLYALCPPLLGGASVAARPQPKKQKINIAVLLIASYWCTPLLTALLWHLYVQWFTCTYMYERILWLYSSYWHSWIALFVHFTHLLTIKIIFYVFICHFHLPLIPPVYLRVLLFGVTPHP